MKLLDKIAITFTLALTALSAPAALINDAKVAAVDSLRTELANTKSPTDSLNIMLNLYDLYNRTKGNAMAGKMVDIAMRTEDYATALDIIRNDANRNMRNDAHLDSLEVFVSENFRPSEARDETTAFLRMVRNMRRAIYTDKLDRTKLLYDFREQFNREPSNNLYDRIVLLHGMAMVLSQDPNAELLHDTLDSLEVLVDQLPPSVISIRNLYHVHAATANLDNDPVRSLAADRESLKDIERLEEYFKKNDRPFRDYALNRYTIYNRMLSSFAVMDDEEFEDIYKKVTELIDEDANVRAQANGFPYYILYRALHDKDYATAFPLLDQLLASDRYNGLSIPRRIRMMRWYVESAEALGKKDSQLKGSMALNEMLDAEMKFRTQAIFRQIRLAYADYEMRRRYNEMEVDSLVKRNRLTNVVTILSVVALIMMSAFLVMLLLQYRKMRIMAKSLKSSNAKLKRESQNLKTAQRDLVRARDTALKANALKSDFIKNLSHEITVPLNAITEYAHLISDFSDPTAREALSRYNQQIDYNCDLLSTIFNDALHLSQLESDTMPVQRQTVSLLTICNTALDTIRTRVKNPELTLKLDDDCPDIQIATDQSRLHQILLKLLYNAVKFTHRGTITLGYKLDEDTNTVRFHVTDTGIGINPENKEKIFERFVKLDPNVQGAGLGLTLARMMARMLGGDLVLDTTYLDGASFILTLPNL